MRVVLDANIYLRQFLSPVSPALAIMAEWCRGGLDLLTSTAQLGELDDVLNRPAIRALMFPGADPDHLLEQLWNNASEVDLRKPFPPFPRDPKDAHLLAMLRDGKADFLVTEDKDLLELGTFAGARIMRVHEFLQMLNASRGQL